MRTACLFAYPHNSLPKWFARQIFQCLPKTRHGRIICQPGRYSAVVVVQTANTTLPCNGLVELAGWLADWLADWLALHVPSSRITHSRNCREREERKREIEKERDLWRHAQCVAQDVLRIGSRGRDWSFNSTTLRAPWCVHWTSCLSLVGRRAIFLVSCYIVSHQFASFSWFREK